MRVRPGDIVKLREFQYTELVGLLDSETLSLLTHMVCGGVIQSSSVGLVVKTWSEEKIMRGVLWRGSMVSTSVKVILFAEVAWPEGVMPAIPVEFLDKISGKD